MERIKGSLEEKKAIKITSNQSDYNKAFEGSKKP